MSRAHALAHALAHDSHNNTGDSANHTVHYFHLMASLKAYAHDCKLVSFPPPNFVTLD